MNCQINILKLVYPPISNQEAEWIKDDPEVRELLKSSHLYMIVQRAESKYILDEELVWDKFSTSLKIPFVFQAGNYFSDVEIDVMELLKYYGISIQDMRCCLEIELGEKCIRLWKCDKKTKERIEVIFWFTTEKILYDKWRGCPGISGLDNYKDFANYRLHYVGISNKEDSLTRLVIKPHDKRVRILSNEGSISEKSRVTDEMILLFFRVEPLRIAVIIDPAELGATHKSLNRKLIIADAEKAFAHILKSAYNKIQFSEYPKGTDGLYDSGLSRYGYILGEDITLRTDTETFVGGYVSETSFPNDVDLILVEGDTVSLVKKEQ